ncbi:MAG: glycosyltransferase family 4 protein [Candidatus Omnitrophica bacterium]|nr:glycosyltransferase family 4 protein [Candidatus Omnitrophota bacterium]
MRVGIDARILAYPRSGIAAYLVGLLEELRSIAELDLVLFSDRPLLADYASAIQGLEQVVFGFSKRRYWANWLLASKLKECRIDLYHAIWDAGIPFFAHCPSLLTLHSITPFQRPPYVTVDMIGNPKKRLFYRLIFEIERRIARKIIVTSEYMRQYIHQHAGVPLPAMEVVYLGVDRMFTRITEDQRLSLVSRKYGLAGRKFFLAVPSRIMEERKNMPMIIKGFNSFCEQRPGCDIPLVVVGEFLADRSEAEERLFAGLGAAVREKVLFLGHVPREELAVLLNLCEALVYPSFYEGFGLPLVEAFACGAPVLAANNSCIPEVTGGAALLVDPFDFRALAGGLIQFLEQPDFKESLRKKGAARACLFSWKNNAQRTYAMYRSLCAHKK